MNNQKINKLQDNQAYKLLEKYKIPVAKHIFIKNSKTFRKDIESAIMTDSKKNQLFAMEFPIVLKIDGDVIHKKQAGCVEIIYNNSELKPKLDNILKNSKKFKTHGMIIQEFIQGKEVMLGAKRDPQFGTIIMFGAGGVLANMLKDVSFRVLPAEHQELEIMVKETKAYQVFIEHDEQLLQEIIELIQKLIRLVEADPKIKELDINPLFLSDEPIAGDVRIIY
ncbi:MAG: acetate--CoA ligase family protein [Candidatus Aenigmatarchaeota archaeon]